MATPKLVIIGLDAADFGLARRYIADGDMPRLAAIGAQSCFSKLRSTVPAQTAPAWTSMTTGVNPGKHGIYYFYNFSTSPITIINATDSQTPRVWDYVEAVGGRSVVVNVPVTYPARKISGSMVAGIPPWFTDEKSVYPDGLLERMKAAGYEIDTPLSRGLEKKPQLLVERLLETERTRVEFFLDLLREQEWSFGMIVLTALDRLQHKVLGKSEDGDEAVRQGYKGVDSLVGKVLDSLGGGVNYLVASDHGFNPKPLAFYPNSWLHEKGLLKRKSSIRNKLYGKAHDIFDGHLLWLPQSLTKRFQGAATVVHTIDAVDLEASRAFVPGTDGVVVVKSKEDEDAILTGLSALKDDAGKEVCAVFKREQVYKGARVDAAPQLLIIPREDINIRTDPFSPTHVSRSGKFAKANHGQEGILLAVGPDIKKSEGQEAAIEDVAATALVLLGIEPPDWFDGEALDSMLARPKAKRSLQTAGALGEDREYAFSEKEEKLVMDNLKRLGYT